MKVVHLSTYTAQGGAGIATLRIHKKLLEQGIDSNLLVFKPSGSLVPGVTEIRKGFFYKARDFFFFRIDNLFFRNKIRPGAQQFSFNFFRRVNIRHHPLIKQADIVCLYWVGANFLTPKQIGQINKPLVWRLSDKWPFTGGCHYSGDCKRYEDHCGSCPQLVTNKRKDFTWFQWRKKNNAWHNKNITIVAPSNWIADAAGKSSLFRNKSIVRVGTGVDHTIFKPNNKQEAKQALSISSNSKVILFGASNALASTYKGGTFFRKLIEQMADRDFVFLLFGSDKTHIIDDIYKKVKFLGVLKEESELRQAYIAADIFICPSIEDNLPNTVLEAMACGTPCIAFRNSGGVIDVIDHKENGYLAEFKNVDDLVNGISWISEANTNGSISLKAREKILKEFTLDKQVNSLIKIYHSVLKK
jgi:glycosyltransferase involved in cell wall biosynthesis